MAAHGLIIYPHKSFKIYKKNNNLENKNSAFNR